MIMMCAPLCEAIDSVLDDEAVVVYMSPRGKVLKQALAREYAKFEHIIIICGHYEGIDQRVLQKYNVIEISIGDYVLTGGELPAMVTRVFRQTCLNTTNTPVQPSLKVCVCQMFCSVATTQKSPNGVPKTR